MFDSFALINQVQMEARCCVLDGVWFGWRRLSSSCIMYTHQTTRQHLPHVKTGRPAGLSEYILNGSEFSGVSTMI
jgi:hypothetical protein